MAGAWAEMAMAAAWQSTALLGLVLAASVLLGRRPARAHAVLVLGIAACLLAPGAGLAARAMGLGLWEAAAARVESVSVIGAGESAPGASSDRRQRAPVDSAAGERGAPAAATSTGPFIAPARAASGLAWRRLGLAAWGAASVLLLARLAWAFAAGMRVRGRACEDVGILRAVKSAARRLGVREPRVVRCAGVGSPAIWCWSAPPRVLVPEGAGQGVDWEGVFAHELAHRRRWDHATGLLAELLVCLAPWQPLGWWARARLRALAERACDDWAVAGAASGTGYARAILSFAAGRSARLALPAVSDAGSVRARVERIVRGGAGEPRAGRAFAAACAAGAVMAAGVVAVARPREAAEPVEQLQQPGAPLAQPSARDVGALRARFGALPKTGWREAFALGQDAAALPPEEGVALLREHWGGLSVQARQQMLKAWVYRMPYPLKARMHPGLVDVLDLGMADAEPEVQTWAAGFLKEVALRELEPGSAPYARWRQGAMGRRLDEVVADAAAAWVERVRAGGDVTADLELVARSTVLRDWAPARTAAAKAGVPAVLELLATAGRVGAGEEPVRIAGLAVRAIGQLEVDEGYLRRVVVPLLRDPALAAEVRASAVRALGKETNAWACDELLAALRDAVERDGGRGLGELGFALGQALAAVKCERAIPVLIGAIEADNGYHTVYGLGYFGLTRLTGVEYDEIHTGPWWRGWWEKNKGRYPGAGEIAPMARTAGYQPSEYDALPHLGEVRQETAEELLARLIAKVEAADTGAVFSTAMKLGKLGDKRIIPTLIGVIGAKESYETVYGVGYFALQPLTGVSYDKTHNGAWWKAWWESNRAAMPDEASRLDVPAIQVGGG